MVRCQNTLPAVKFYYAALGYAKDALQGHLLGPYPISLIVGFRLKARSGWIGFLPII
jgi:hypothetical protein